MTVKELRLQLYELAASGHDDKEIVCYIEHKGEPLKIAEVYYDIKLDEPNLSIRP